MKLPKKFKKSDLEAARERLFELQRVQNEAREEEKEIREVLADIFHDEEEGSKTITFEGIKLTVTRPLTRSITKEDAERLCNDQPELSVEALDWKPNIKVSVFKANAEVLGEYVTTRPGLPTVTFK